MVATERIESTELLPPKIQTSFKDNFERVKIFKRVYLESRPGTELFRGVFNESTDVGSDQRNPKLVELKHSFGAS